MSPSGLFGSNDTACDVGCRATSSKLHTLWTETPDVRSARPLTAFELLSDCLLPTSGMVTSN